MGLEQDNIFPMLSPTPEIVRFGGYKYSESLLDLVQIGQGFQIVTKSPDCLNVIWRDGALWQLDGNEKYENDVITGAPTVGGLFTYGQESSGTTYVIATTGTKVWRYSGSAWVDITGAYSLGGSGQHFGLTFNDDFIGVTSNRDAPYKIEGTANIAALGGSPPSGKVIGRIGEFIVIGNTAANKSYAYYCDPGNAESGWSKFWDVKSDDTQGLTAVGELDQRSGYLFKEKTANRIQHLGGISFQHDRDYLPKGIVAQATLKNCTVIRNGQAIKALVGLSDDGVYAFDTSKNPFLLSEDISFKFDRNNAYKWNRSYWSMAHAVYDPTRQLYWLWVPSASSTGQMDELWILDLRTLDWWPANPNAAASICMINDSNGNPQVHVGGYDGYVRKFGQTLKNYDSAVINAYYATGVIDFKSDIFLRQFIPFAKQVGNYNLDFSLKWNLAQAVTASDALLLTKGGGLYGSGTYGTAVYGSGRPVFKNLPALNRRGDHLQIYFGNSRVNENFSLYKIKMPSRQIGGSIASYR